MAAGPVALAREHLDDGEPFFVFNSDITCEYPLQDLLDFHRRHGKEGTICVTRVAEPSKYGVVVSNEHGCIQHFVEKPQTFVGNRINAGLYVFNPSILDRIEPRPMSIEKEVRLIPATLAGFSSTKCALMWHRCCFRSPLTIPRADLPLHDIGGKLVRVRPERSLDGHWPAA